MSLAADGESQDPAEASLSRDEYWEKLRCPTAHERQRISELQIIKEREIDGKYHALRGTSEERAAAMTIQKAYRGHRERRQLDGLVLDPSTRWVELIREMRYRTATAPRVRTSFSSPPGGRSRGVSDARRNWQRAVSIAEHAVEGGRSRSSSEPTVAEVDDVHTELHPASVLLDRRYFLEMVDQKHRYGANLLVYHEEWRRSDVDENFFIWLDHGQGRYIDLPGCARDRLDRERIRYLSKDERKDYLVRADSRGRLCWHKTGELITTSTDFKDSMNGIVPASDTSAAVFDSDDVQRQLSGEREFANAMAGASLEPCDTAASERGVATSLAYSSSLSINSTLSEPPVVKRKRRGLHVSSATIFNHLLRACVKPGTWIYVADTVGRLYVGIKSSGAFQHTSFLAGSRISSAGLIGIEHGRLTYLSPMSGHYRPNAQVFRTFLHGLEEQGVDMSSTKISRAYEILRTMEIYGRVKKAMHGKGPGGGPKEARSPEPGQRDSHGSLVRIRSPEANCAHARANGRRGRAEGGG